MARSFKDLCLQLKLSLMSLNSYLGSIDAYYKRLGEIFIDHNEKAIDILLQHPYCEEELHEYYSMTSTISIVSGILEILKGEDIFKVAKELEIEHASLEDLKTILFINEDGSFDIDMSFKNARNIIELMSELV